MCVSIVEQLRRSIFARIPAQIIKTTDVAQAQEDVVNFLNDEDHVYTTWSPIQGSRSTVVMQGGASIGLADEDRSYGGDIQAILRTWEEDRLDKVYKCHRQVQDGGPYYEPVVRDEPPPSGDETLLHNTLVIIGGEIFLDPSSHQYDPISVHAVWEIMQCNLRDLTNLIIVIPMDANLPDKITAAASMIEDELPTRKEFFDVIWPAFVQGCPPSLLAPLNNLDEIAPLVVDRLCGLTRPAARNTLTSSIIHMAHKGISKGNDATEFFLSKLAESKEIELKKSSALEVMKATPMEKIGGLDKYKEWITPRRLAFSEEARRRGIPRPKGVLLVGPPGTGKTEVAKATAATLGVPLIRADLGAIYGGLVGASEANMRNMLKTLEAAAPCVVLFDEIEKALGGSTGPSTDSGTSQRVFGTLLSWMQDRDQENMIFIVATANNVSGLPPEFLRKGRFDELFFVDLPNKEERTAILNIHLEPVADMFSQDYLATVVERTEGFVGAELAQAVIEARISTFATEQGGLAPGGASFTGHLLQAIRDTRPLSITMAEKIDAVRTWASSRARPASTAAGTEASGKMKVQGMSFQGIG